jgi:hypothetical protein
LIALIALIVRVDKKIWMLLAQNIAVPASTLHWMFKKDCFWHHTSPLIPFLTEENKVARVAYCLEEIDGATVVGQGPVHYKDMFNWVDINEKWFYQTSDSKNYILTAAEFENENDGVEPQE